MSEMHNKLHHGSRFLSFSLGEEEYAIPLLSVREVIAVPNVTPIPYTPPHFLGIMNLRGNVISLIDLRKKFAIKPKENAETSVIICDLGDVALGVVVDSVNQVLTPRENDISAKPSIESNRNTDFITSVYRRDKHLVLFLDIEKALTGEDKAAIQKSTQKAA